MLLSLPLWSPLCFLVYALGFINLVALWSVYCLHRLAITTGRVSHRQCSTFRPESVLCDARAGRTGPTTNRARFRFSANGGRTTNKTYALTFTWKNCKIPWPRRDSMKCVVFSVDHLLFFFFFVIFFPSWFTNMVHVQFDYGRVHSQAQAHQLPIYTNAPEFIVLRSVSVVYILNQPFRRCQALRARFDAELDRTGSCDSRQTGHRAESKEPKRSTTITSHSHRATTATFGNLLASKPFCSRCAFFGPPFDCCCAAAAVAAAARLYALERLLSFGTGNGKTRYADCVFDER